MAKHGHLTGYSLPYCASDETLFPDCLSNVAPMSPIDSLEMTVSMITTHYSTRDEAGNVTHTLTCKDNTTRPARTFNVKANDPIMTESLPAMQAYLTRKRAANFAELPFVSLEETKPEAKSIRLDDATTGPPLDETRQKALPDGGNREKAKGNPAEPGNGGMSPHANHRGEGRRKPPPPTRTYHQAETRRQRRAMKTIGAEKLFAEANKTTQSISRPRQFPGRARRLSC